MGHKESNQRNKNIPETFCGESVGQYILCIPPYFELLIIRNKTFSPNDHEFMEFEYTLQNNVYNFASFHVVTFVLDA